MVQLQRPAQGDALRLFDHHRAEAHTNYPNTWVFPGASMPPEVEEYLRAEKIGFTSFFEIQPTATDSPDMLAAYLWLGYFEALREEEADLLLTRHTGLQEIIASTRLARELSEISPDIRWRNFGDRRGFMVLNPVPQLPDPVVVPHAVFVSEGETGIWAVRSDGRELLTSGNLEYLMLSGIANPTHCAVDGRLLRWRRGLIFGGRVLAFLMEHDVVGVRGLPSFLGRTDL
ncbi:MULTISPECIES: hypothetical protein [unclassified Streptomyces]|uniref:hypothetical protein n=1 Tax=unclassified Streptomyces TaxID=2593676 RepID=UPI00114C8D44|nr:MULTISPECIES: hypothetical protein [unclassified Streptomyces]